MEDKSLATTKT